MRPHVICHMCPSVDGRIVIDHWRIGSALTRAYEKTAKSFNADAWIAGRVSMEPYAGKAKVPTRSPSTKLPRTDFVAEHDARSYALTIDQSGKINWASGDIDGEHVITVLTEAVSDDYLAFLRSNGVSYVFGGKREVDLKKVLTTLRRTFGIKTLLLEGGGGINGTFLKAGLIDELSLLLAPIADGSHHTPTLFDTGLPRGAVKRLSLKSMTRQPGDIAWLRYTVRR